MGESKGKTFRKHYKDIANALRAKIYTSRTYTPPEMALAIDDIEGVFIDKLLDRTISGNIELPTASKIKPYYFDRCSEITAVSAPNVLEIGCGAFYSCTGISKVDISRCKHIREIAFASCYSLRTLSSLEECLAISSAAFTYCSSLEHVVLPKCSIIYGGGFYMCSNLTDCYAPLLEKLGSNVFANCNLSEISHPICSEIGAGVFRQNSYVSMAYLPVCSVVPEGAFALCSSLESVVLDFSRITSIGSEAFQECVTIESVTSFSNVETIGSYAFARCWSLTDISFPECTNIDSLAFCQCVMMPNVDFPKAESIGQGAFALCNSLSEVSLPKVSRIGEMAFLECPNLEKVTLPVCKSIPDGAFARCVTATTLSFPECSQLGWLAFEHCSMLNDVYLLASTPVELITPSLISDTWVIMFNPVVGAMKEKLLRNLNYFYGKTVSEVPSSFYSIHDFFFGAELSVSGTTKTIVPSPNLTIHVRSSLYSVTISNWASLVPSVTLARVSPF